MKRKSIILKILSFIGIPVTAVFILTTIFISVTVKQSVSQLTTADLTSKSQNASNEINNYLSKYITTAEQVMLNANIRSFLNDAGSKSNIMEVPGFVDVMNTLQYIRDADKDNILNCWIADTASNQVINQVGGVNELQISSSPWFKSISERKKWTITDPYVESTTKKLTVSIIEPYYGEDGNLIGAAGVDITLDRLYDEIKSYKLGDSGFYILTSTNGNMVYYPDQKLKNKKITESKMSDNIIKAMQSKKSGFLSFTAMGHTNFGYVADVGETGWSVATGLPETEYFHSYNEVLLSLLFISLIALAIIIVLIIIMSRSIVNPLVKLRNNADEIAAGNLDVNVEVTSSDEVGRVAASLSRTVARLKQYIEYINEISVVLNRIAAGDLTFNLQCDYTGDFSKIKDSLENIKVALKNTFAEINMSADEVASGSEQVSNASRALAQGATEQASSIEQLSASVKEISQHVSANANNAATANALSENVAVEFKHSTELMTQMMDGMTEINISTSQIGKIVKVIEDIAFQTNILALNAAVEAARAGEAGKGFAVVAEEVRNLASRSAEEAKDTTVLIESAVQSVQHGSEIANQTQQALSTIEASSKESADLMKDIAQACSKQAISIKEVMQGLDRISVVVQNNSATSEESAASSEELSQQAKAMKMLVNQFRID